MNVKKHKKSFLVGLTLLFIGVAILSASFLVIAPSTPHRFLGYATDTLLNPIKDGIVIRAMVVDVDGSTENHTTTVNNYLSGKNYDFDVLDLEEDNDGRPIYFYVGSENTTQSVNFVIGGKNVGFSDYYNLTIVDVPQITDNSSSNGTTGDPFTFNVTVLDYVDEAGNLTVSANWSHGSLSGNQSLSNVAGNYFEVNITLDHSINNMTYTVWANDTSGNMNSSGPHTVTVTDNDPPTSSVDAISSYWKIASDNPLTINATANDNIGLNNVTLYYYNSTDNSTFAGPWSFGVDTDPWVGVSWNFSFPNASGYYRFYSIATDNASLTESAPLNNDTLCGYDTIAPTVDMTALSTYKNDDFTVAWAINTEATSGVATYTVEYFCHLADS